MNSTPIDIERQEFQRRLFAILDEWDIQEQEILRQPAMDYDAKMRLTKVLAVMLDGATAELRTAPSDRRN